MAYSRGDDSLTGELFHGIAMYDDGVWVTTLNPGASSRRNCARKVHLNQLKGELEMNRLRNTLFTLAGLGILPVIGSLMSSHHAVAQGPPNGQAVNIVNPLPVPVTGMVNVGNLGAATLPVAVSNFPATQNISGTVNVGALPTVHSVVLNNPGSIPFVGGLSRDIPNLIIPSTLGGQTVNALVITEVSGLCGRGATQAILRVGVWDFFFPINSSPDAVGNFQIPVQHTNIFLGPGFVADIESDANCSLNFAGYYATQ
jgi:hypothetical protein